MSGPYAYNQAYVDAIRARSEEYECALRWLLKVARDSSWAHVLAVDDCGCKGCAMKNAEAVLLLESLVEETVEKEMTAEEAQAEAQRRWGKAAFVLYAPHNDKATPYVVSQLWRDEEKKYFGVTGRGASWKQAFVAADEDQAKLDARKQKN